MKAHTYRIYPNKSQKELFALHFGHVRHVYNWALDLKQASYEKDKTSLSKRDLQDLLVASKKEEKKWLCEVNSQSLLSALDQVDRAYKNFFKKQIAYPRFKKKNAKQSFCAPQHAKVESEKNILHLPKIKNIKIKLHREVAENFKSVTISKNPSGKYYASFVIEEREAKKEFKNSKQKEGILGIDLGIENLAILSTGEKIGNPRFLDKSLEGLNTLQKVFARQKYRKEEITYKDKEGLEVSRIRKIYSKNKDKQKQKIASKHEKIANRREDYLHKISTSIVSENQADYIAMEDLAVRNMIRNKRLSRHIANVGWHKFKTLVEYKAKRQGKKLIIIDRWAPSSKTCSNCNQKQEKLALSIRKWQCTSCYTAHDRDINAALNIANFAKNKLTDELGHSFVIKSSPTSMTSQC